MYVDRNERNDIVSTYARPQRRNHEFVRGASPVGDARAERDAALDGLTHDLGDDRVMQVRPRDEQNMKRAIEIMTKNAMPSIMWVMVDNVKRSVSPADLREALAAGQAGALAIWNSYEPRRRL